MSPHAVNDLASSFVQMAKAFEELPLVQAELDRAKGIIDDQADTVQRLELKLIDRSGQIDTLNATIRSLEVSRDDAELRFLEVEDKLAKVINLVKGAAGDLGLMISEPKPELTLNEDHTPSGWSPNVEPIDDGGPYNEPVPEWQHVEGSVSTDPIGGTEDTGTHASTESQGETSVAPSSAHASDGTVSPGEGQSAVDPTALTDTGSETASSQSVEPQGSVDTSVGNYDPEPFIKFSNEWYDWEGRQRRKNHKAAE